MSMSILVIQGPQCLDGVEELLHVLVYAEQLALHHHHTALLPGPSQHAAVHLQRLYLRLQLLHLLLVHGQDVRLLPVALRHPEAVPAQVDVLLYLAELVSLHKGGHVIGGHVGHVTRGDL